MFYLTKLKIRPFMSRIDQKSLSVCCLSFPYSELFHTFSYTSPLPLCLIASGFADSMDDRYANPEYHRAKQIPPIDLAERRHMTRKEQEASEHTSRLDDDILVLNNRALQSLSLRGGSFCGNATAHQCQASMNMKAMASI